MTESDGKEPYIVYCGISGILLYHTGYMPEEFAVALAFLMGSLGMLEYAKEKVGDYQQTDSELTEWEG